MIIKRLKGQNSKRVLQENKLGQMFRKTNISYPMQTYTHVTVSGGKKCSFFGNFACFFSCNTCFEIRTLALLETNYSTFAQQHHYF